MLPPPPVLAPPVGAALALALPVVSGAGGVAVVELGAGAALVELGAGVGGAVVGLVGGGVGGAVVELDGVGFGVFEQVGIPVIPTYRSAHKPPRVTQSNKISSHLA